MFHPKKIISIHPDDNVLEIGPGSTPHPRANVLLDRHFESDQIAHAQRGYASEIKYEQPVVYYDGGKFPFKDKEFDYVICSHVLEHVPVDELEQFIVELQRVASRGYIEYPNVFYELINYQDVHKWFMNYRDNQILFLDKKVFKSNYIHKTIREAFYGTDKYLYASLGRYKDFFFSGFEWFNSIRYEIVDSYDALVNEKDYDTWKRFYLNFQPSASAIKSTSKIRTIIDWVKIKLPNITISIHNLKENSKFTKEFYQFSEMQNRTSIPRFKMLWEDRYPILNEKTATTRFDAHYVYHPAWAARILAQTNPSLHIDISSTLHFCAIVSAFIPTEFYDYRPADLNLSGLQSRRCDLIHLPFADNSVESLSCMHVVEHIGLGRYSDPLAPDGDLKAIEQLKRVLKNGGSLLFVVPVGKPRIQYNAHRIYSYEQIASYFSGFRIEQFALVNDLGQFSIDANPADVDRQSYGCGCWWFIKP